MKDYYTDETAYTLDNFKQLLEAHDSAPEWLVKDDEHLERIVNLAEQRAGARGEQSALEEGETECLLATDWHGWASDEFGFDGDESNQVALGVLNARASADRDAILFNDTVVVQTGWLRSGDGRKTQMKPYVDEEYDNSSEGELWVPRGAANYIAIIALSSELVHGTPDLAEAM
jgi:hypothetical protein